MCVFCEPNNPYCDCRNCDIYGNGSDYADLHEAPCCGHRPVKDGYLRNSEVLVGGPERLRDIVQHYINNCTITTTVNIEPCCCGKHTGPNQICHKGWGKGCSGNNNTFCEDCPKCTERMKHDYS